MQDEKSTSWKSKYARANVELFNVSLFIAVLLFVALSKAAHVKLK